jgi:tRNA threonylcarbamoyladenosine biosynthesis protein TsaB
MLVLGINTSGDACEAALSRDGAVVATLSEPMTTGHDARLAPVVRMLMQEAGFGFDQLDRIAIVVGPGSFTGIRVGVAFARGLSLAAMRETPAVGVSSLEALDGLPKGRVLGLLPAKRRPPERTWWAQALADGRGAGEPVEAGEEDIVRLASGMDSVCGQLDGVPDIGLPRVAAMPTASAAAIFAARLAAGDLPGARPIYVREPDAKPMRPVAR